MACLSDDSCFSLSDMLSTHTLLSKQEEEESSNNTLDSKFMELKLEKVFPVYAMGFSKPDPPPIVRLLNSDSASDDPIWDAVRQEAKLEAEKEPILSGFNSHVLQGAEMVGVGQLFGPEDLAYDPNSGLIYTGCSDGWIKRVTVNESVADSVVENLVNTGGRPLGLVLGHHNDLVIADANKGLLKVTSDGEIDLLTDEAEGVKFKLTDGVDITNAGMLYFTDASEKYSLNEMTQEISQGQPYGRLMSYDPSTKQTKVLVRDIYFANGVVVSPDQSFVIFCETRMRCKRYYIQGERKAMLIHLLIIYMAYLTTYDMMKKANIGLD